MAQYTLAIVIPSWNVSAYISAMLDCIIAQSLKDWQLFCIDDRCTDGTSDILSRYADKDERIHHIMRDREPRGAQTCRNIGLEFSEGAKYIIWLDADDLIAPYCFKQRVEFMERHEELDFAVFPSKRFSDNPNDENIDVWGYDYLGDCMKCFFHRTLMMTGWTNIYRRNSVIRHNLWWDVNIQSLQDADWNIQAIQKGLSFSFASKEGGKIDYFYRTVDDGISSNIKTVGHLGSHLIHLNKILDSLTAEQQSLYEMDIKAMILIFFDIMIKDKDSLHQFVSLLWIRRHPLLRFKLLLLCCSKGRGKKYLFRKEILYHRMIWSNWWQYKEQQYRLADKNYGLS